MRRITGKDKSDYVKDQQHALQRNTQHHTEQGRQQEKRHAPRHRKDQHPVGDGLDLVGQHLQIRFGKRDHKAQQKS